MERLILLFLLAFFYISCQKECKTCKSVTRDVNTGNIIQQGNPSEYCDEDLEKIEKEEPVTVGDQQTKWECE